MTSSRQQTSRHGRWTWGGRAVAVTLLGLMGAVRRVARRPRFVLLFSSPFLLLLLATVAAAVDPPTWPKTFAQNGDQMVVYQPQMDGWTNRVTLKASVPVIVTPKGGSADSGVLHVTAQTDTDMQQRTVTLSHLRITNADFSSAPAAVAAQAAKVAQALLPTGSVSMPLDYLLARLVQDGGEAPSVALATAPPTVFVAAQPSRLLLFDGTPTFATVTGTSVQYAVNTNWPLLRSTDAAGYYLLDSTGWMTADSLDTGIWQYATELPASFSQLPNDPNWQDVVSHIPPQVPEGQPPLQVYVSTTPAELIVLVGDPQYDRIPNTGIFAVTNTDSLLFWDGYAKAFYYLVTGRWFRAPLLDGPWTYATNSLPPDFASIPTDGPYAAVLASVPGTDEAHTAALEAGIPHLATVKRSTAAASVAYDGAPQFAPIEGTSLSYAVNTGSDIIRVDDAYYLCQKGVWFTSTSPNGPWSVATSVPNAIYSIPPSSPVYNVTYVNVYDTTDDSVVDGYSDGYLGEYVGDGVVTWGTGYYYPPYVVAGTTPYYYARPYTYGCDAYYNPATRTFHRAGYGYGPYGGFRAGADYNPTTGTYARGVAAYGPYQSGEAVQAYNPRTGTYAAGYQRSNPYASWEQGVVYGPNRAAQAGAYSNDRGTVAHVQTSNGTDAYAATNGDRSAGVVHTPGGNWYAGGDGNIYRHTDDGWQRYQAPQGGRASGVGHAAGAGGYVPSHPVPQGSYVPSQPVTYGLNQEYAARQRQTAMAQRNAAVNNRGFGNYGGGRYAGGARGGGMRGGGRR